MVQFEVNTLNPSYAKLLVHLDILSDYSTVGLPLIPLLPARALTAEFLQDLAQTTNWLILNKEEL